MLLRRIAIKNYKSLKDVDIRPSGLTALIGPNASGKSNFVDAISFLSEVYEHGLEVAIARKGGVDNIAFRRARRTRDSLSFSVEIEFSYRWHRGVPLIRSGSAERPKPKQESLVRVSHSFSFKAGKKLSESGYNISNEEMEIGIIEGGKVVDHMRLSRSTSEFIEVEKPSTEELRHEFYPFLGEMAPPEGIPIGAIATSPGQDLLFPRFPFGSNLLRMYRYFLSSIKVAQMSPPWLRHPGVPTPNPSMSETGENLPAVIDWIRRKEPDQWKGLLGKMRSIVPGLSDIDVRYTTNKAVELSFSEEKVGRPWGANEVSDGTLLTLASLVNLADSRNSMFVIEEPENSVHPWILREIVERMREVSKQRTIILTTHSLSLIDSLSPEEIWVVSNPEGSTQIRRLSDLCPKLEQEWKDGEIRLSEAFDMGLVPPAVPGAS